MTDFLKFLEKSPTAYHAAHEIGIQLQASGFSLLNEKEIWNLAPGKGYFVLRDHSLVAAFRMPQKNLSSASLLASHLDSPALKLKPHPSHGKGQLNTEVYGAPLLHTWMDRELVICGNITVLNDNIETKTIFLKEHPVIIPSLAIHLERTIGEKGVCIHKQDHLKPIFSLCKDLHLEEVLREIYGFKKWLSSDLFLVPMQPPSFVGRNEELIAAYRLDNLTSAWSSLQAITKAKAQDTRLQMAIFWDHEEIGSVSNLGAGSSFVDQLLIRIGNHFKMEPENLFCLKQESLCISADLAHGFHPNFADKYDADNSPFLGKGVVLKFNANQKYATNSINAAKILLLAERHKIPIQNFACRSDIPSGSTVGPIMAGNTGIPTVDLGICGWAMHSARETVSSQDLLSLNSLLLAVLQDNWMVHA